MDNQLGSTSDQSIDTALAMFKEETRLWHINEESKPDCPPECICKTYGGSEKVWKGALDNFELAILMILEWKLMHPQKNTVRFKSKNIVECLFHTHTAKMLDATLSKECSNLVKKRAYMNLAILNSLVSTMYDSMMFVRSQDAEKYLKLANEIK